MYTLRFRMHPCVRHLYQAHLWALRHVCAARTQYIVRIHYTCRDSYAVPPHIACAGAVCDVWHVARKLSVFIHVEVATHRWEALLTRTELASASES